MTGWLNSTFKEKKKNLDCVKETDETMICGLVDFPSP